MNLIIYFGGKGFAVEGEFDRDLVVLNGLKIGSAYGKVPVGEFIKAVPEMAGAFEDADKFIAYNGVHQVGGYDPKKGTYDKPYAGLTVCCKEEILLENGRTRVSVYQKPLSVQEVEDSLSCYPSYLQ